jgi:hypothetical protein
MDRPNMSYPSLNSSGMEHAHAQTKCSACAVCGLDTFRHKGWFLVIENRWLDRLKILSWHPSLAGQNGMKSVCCRQHLKTLVAHWLTQASLHLSPADFHPLTMSSESESQLQSQLQSELQSELQSMMTDVDLGPDSLGRLVGELAVHRESFSRVWSGSPEALECILDALITIGAENKSHALEFRLSEAAESSRGMSLQ